MAPRTYYHGMAPRTYYHGLGHQVITSAHGLILLGVVLALAAVMLMLKRAVRLS